MLIMFDLPTLTQNDMRAYRRFRKFLIKSGFIMMQESIYSKLVLNNETAKLVSKQVRKNIPCDGLVQMLVVTEKQFGSMEILVGNVQTTYIDNDKRLIEL